MVLVLIHWLSRKNVQTDLTEVQRVCNYSEGGTGRSHWLYIVVKRKVGRIFVTKYEVLFRLLIRIPVATVGNKMSHMDIHCYTVCFASSGWFSSQELMKTLTGVNCVNLLISEEDFEMRCSVHLLFKTNDLC